MTVPMLLLGGGAFLMAVIGVAVAVLAQDQRNRRVRLRIAERVTPLAPAQAPRAHDESEGMTAVLAAIRDWMLKLSGQDPERADAYPARVPLLLMLAIVPAIVIERVIGRVAGISLDAAIPVFWLGCSRMLFSMLHARHADKLYRQFPDTLSMIVRAVRAGIPLQEAIRGVARESPEPTAQQFARVSDQLAIGIRLEEALRETSARTGVAEYAFFTVALSLQAQTGGSLADTLENLAEVIRKRVALRKRAIALASEARTSAYVLAALPVVTGFLLSVINFSYIEPLFDTPGGNRVLFLAIGMLGTAGISMRYMIKKSLQ